jgi:cell wall-associated NlpC family hydrolase
MSEVIVPVAAPVVAFGRRNANEERIRKAEEEIKALTEARENPPEKADDDEKEPEGSEERTFKKRYGDLRRHSQKLQDDLQTQIDSLKEQLTKTTQKEIRLPKSEDELNAWAREYPDVYKIVETIAIKKAKEQSTSIEDRLKRIDEAERNTAREKAEFELLRLHPDFGDIRDEDEFHEWVAEQPVNIQQALYENDTDAKAAARAIDLYKSDKGIKTNKKTSDKDLASAVGRGSRSAPSSANTEGLIYESQVEKMSMNEFEKNAEAILTAQRTNKFVYDVTGNAR